MRSAVAETPWAASSPVKGGLAVGSLREILMQRLIFNGRLHVETLLTAIGALAGYASQNAFWQESGLSPEGVPAIGTSAALIVAAHTLSGERFFFGDGPNAFLTEGQGGDVTRMLWPLLRGKLVEAGVSADKHPPVEPMFAHVSRAVGTPGFGLPSLPGHLPAASAEQFVRGQWSMFRRVLARPPPPGIAEGEPDLPETYWPMVAFLVAGQFLVMSKDQLDPSIGAQIIMEAAIAGAKIDPATVPSR